MSDIRWFESDVDPSTVDDLSGFDHYRIEIDSEPAVLITYVRRTNPERGLLAVVHPAALQHPEAPGWLIEVVEGLAWAPCPPPAFGG